MLQYFREIFLILYIISYMENIMKKQKKINSGDIISRNKDHISAELDGELVLMSIENGKYYGMSSIARRIWELIEQPIVFKDICRILNDEYDADKDQINQETTYFLTDLQNEKLIKIQQHC